MKTDNPEQWLQNNLSRMGQCPRSGVKVALDFCIKNRGKKNRWTEDGHSFCQDCTEKILPLRENAMKDQGQQTSKDSGQQTSLAKPDKPLKRAKCSREGCNRLRYMGAGEITDLCLEHWRAKKSVEARAAKIKTKKEKRRRAKKAMRKEDQSTEMIKD